MPLQQFHPFVSFLFGTLGNLLSMSCKIAEIVESSIGIGSSGSASMMPSMSFLVMVTSYGAQLSRTILQLLFLLIDTIASIPEIIGVLGEKMLAM